MQGHLLQKANVVLAPSDLWRDELEAHVATLQSDPGMFPAGSDNYTSHGGAVSIKARSTRHGIRGSTEKLWLDYSEVTGPLNQMKVAALGGDANVALQWELINGGSVSPHMWRVAVRLLRISFVSLNMGPNIFYIRSRTAHGEVSQSQFVRGMMCFRNKGRVRRNTVSPAKLQNPSLYPCVSRHQRK